MLLILVFVGKIYVSLWPKRGVPCEQDHFFWGLVTLRRPFNRLSNSVMKSYNKNWLKKDVMLIPVLTSSESPMVLALFPHSPSCWAETRILTCIEHIYLLPQERRPFDGWKGSKSLSTSLPLSPSGAAVFTSSPGASLPLFIPDTCFFHLEMTSGCCCPVLGSTASCCHHNLLPISAALPI